MRSIIFLVISVLTTNIVSAKEENEKTNKGLARGNLYSTNAVRRVCQDAQKTIAGTTAESINVQWGEDIDGLILSKAEPYADEGEDLPLTTHQIVSYGSQGNKQFPKVISCKLKANDDIVKFIDPTAGPGKTCRDVVLDTFDAVMASLTNPEMSLVVDTDLEVEDDLSDRSGGSTWLVYFPPELVCVDPTDNTLHVQAKALISPNTLYPWPFQFPEPPFWGPEFTGVRYCHLPAAEYLRELLLGNLDAPACE